MTMSNKQQLLVSFPGAAITERNGENQRWLSVALPFTVICESGPFKGKPVLVEFADLFPIGEDDEPHWAAILAIAESDRDDSSVIWTPIDG